MIDIRQCCMEGLNIVQRRYAKLEKFHWREQQLMEAEHMATCPECNTALMASKLFGTQVTIGEWT